MPQKIICKKCHAIMYQGFDVISPIDVILLYNGRCPNCQHKMEFDEKEIKVSLIAPNYVKAVQM